MGFDLANLNTVAAADEGAVMTVLNPATNQPLRDSNDDDVTITLAGVDSEVYRKAQRAATNKRLAMRGRGKLTAEELEAEAIDLLARCTLAWSGIVWQGEALECSPKSARMLYEALPWLKEQADEFVADRSHFGATLAELIAFCEHQFLLDKRDKSGATLRAQLEQVEKATGQRPAQLDDPDCPDTLEHLWQWFLELNSARGYGQHGPNPLTYPDIAAWSALTAAHPTPWEVVAIKKIDAAWLETMHD